mmetsp:Transcript_30394/g.55110  ORF Transcript_30394/g.55110 Transcript_30394/m.55110 type:complete len:297 (-) Transcript_30394:67-957(-)
MKKLSRSVYTPISTLNKNLLHRLRENDTSLIRIIFSSRNLGSQGVNILTQALRTNTNLRELDLTSNSIGSEGAHCIALLLQHQAKNMIASGNNSEEPRGIKTLIIGDNNLRDAGVKAMAEALEKDIMLENLWIDDNFIGASGFALLARALQKNSKLKRLHIRHNSFQSLSPLITCTFDKQSLNSVADSNHTLKHVFLNCGYSYDCEELEIILKINRMGKVEARRKKIALFLEEDLGRLLQIDMNPKLLPRLLGILAQHGSISTLFRVSQHLPSEMLVCVDDPMEVDDPMDVEYISL